MATVRQYLLPEIALFQSSVAFPQYKNTAGTNFPVTGLAFDATTTERCYFRFSPMSYGSNNLTVTVEWYADTATSGGVTWETALAAITPNTDTQDIETKAFATANTASDTHLGTTGQRLHSIDVTVSNLDSLAPNDWVILRLSRLPSDGSDTMTGDAILVGVGISYSDT
ncbi:hypothetical protein ACFWYW_55510 [Nonomuraea sp. NPDC059023]|uniref:hypothetical protein n=1 Tax=unclassified Nonomuraea TaxID=2593643 RepID=UPI0036944EE3